MGCHTSFSKDAVKNFWERKASKYPLPFEEKISRNTQEVLRWLRSEGVSFSGKRILDIGCGKGAFSLALAKEASYVCGIDCSESMLSDLMALAKKMKIENIGIINGFWEDVDPVRENLKDNFDIVMAMMTPAVRSEKDILKMEECSREWVIFMGWVERKNELLKRVFLLHGIEWALSSPFYSILLTLEGLKRRPHFQFFEMSMDYEGETPEVIRELSDYVELYGKNPKKEEMEKEVKKYERDGIVRYRMEAQLGAIFWKPRKEEQ